MPYQTPMGSQSSSASLRTHWMATLLTAHHLPWALVALDIGVDTTSLSGKAMAGMMAVFAELERGMIGLRTREALAAARERGTIVGRRSELPQEVVNRIVSERDAGRSLRAIADGLNADGVQTGQGGRRWYASTIRKVAQRAGTADGSRAGR